MTQRTEWKKEQNIKEKFEEFEKTEQKNYSKTFLSSFPLVREYGSKAEELR